MITKFDSIYAGHVDMGDVGYAGIAVNDRIFPNDHLVTTFDKATNIALKMDGLGYDTLWLAEHHFQPEGYECIPNLLMLSLHLAHLTRNLRLGCGFNITPMWHPLRLAEDYATVDYLTGGRVTFGVGRGYHTREVETFDAPLRDQEGNRDLFEEQVDIIFKAFNEPFFSHHGKYYDLPPRPDVPYRGYDLKEISVVPRPVNLPVECWQPIQSATARGLDYMAKHRMKGMMGGGVAESGAMSNVIEAWRDAQARAGIETQLGENLGIGFHFYVCDDQEQGIKEASAYFEENLKMFGPLRLTRGLSEEQIRDISDPKLAPYADLPSLEKSVKSGAFLCGPADMIVEKLKALESAFPGLERVSMGMPIGTPEAVILEQMDRLAEEVMPAFRPQEARAASAV